MPTLVLDACGSLHLKQLGGLFLLEAHRTRDVTLATATAVYAEQVKMTLSDWLVRERIERVPVALSAVKAAKNQCDQRRLPGKNDLALIALAIARHAVLFTHDDACARGARANGVTVVDVCDLADLHVSRGWSDWEAMETALARLATFAYLPSDWEQTIRATVEARPARSKLLARLDTWWDG